MDLCSAHPPRVFPDCEFNCNQGVESKQERPEASLWGWIFH
jgi:hypothetical protein